MFVFTIKETLYYVCVLSLNFPGILSLTQSYRNYSCICCRFRKVLNYSKRLTLGSHTEKKSVTISCPLDRSGCNKMHGAFKQKRSGRNKGGFYFKPVRMVGLSFNPFQPKSVGLKKDTFFSPRPKYDRIFFVCERWPRYTYYFLFTISTDQSFGSI